MFTFTVNGKTVTSHKDQKLLPFLRDDLRLTSVKNGCSEGACGTCMVLVDGKARKACVLETSKLEGKSILTVEGLSPRERDVYAYAFSEAGAVQCGFCIPGMVISAKGLLDANPSPTPGEVKQAIRGNICRCTGYKKIEEAILLAARLFRENGPVPQAPFTGAVGENMHRVDAAAKVLGEARYTDDIALEGMLYGSAVRSAHPRARILSIDISAAQAADGVAAVVLRQDIPGNPVIGHLRQDWDALLGPGDVTRYIGDAVALIAATSTEALEAAKALVRVEYEVLPPVTCPAEALAEGAPKLHEGGNILATERLCRGDADAAIAASKYVVTEHYSVPFTEHAFLEPETAIAAPENGGIVIYSGDQGVFQTRKECAHLLGFSPEQVRVVGQITGGGFGGKEDMSVQHHAALLAYITQKPVKVSLSRQESIAVHPKRHAMEMEFTTACDENGYLTAMKAAILSDTGAYASLGGPVLQRACTHAAGPYNYQNIDIVGRAVYTNNPPAGAFRGFGVTQSCFATESNINRLAKLAGLSPWEFRYRNAIRPGQTLPNGQIADESTALAETLEAVKEEFDANEYAGVACAMKNSGLGVGIPDIGRCCLAVLGGCVHTRTSAACIGQGLATVVTQIVCEAAGILPERVIHEQPDTSITPDCGNTTASRQTLFCGEAARRAAAELRAAMNEAGSLAGLEGREFYGEYFGETDKMGSEKPNPVSHVAYGYATHLVALHPDGTIKKVVAAHDVGRAVNPRNVEGQIEGGVVMSLGYALREDYPLRDCVPTAKFGALGLFRSTETPPVESVIIEKSQSELACGAKGIGEICSIPTPPAVTAAYESLDGVPRNRLPISGTPYSRKK